jgi:hypothetical protein
MSGQVRAIKPAEYLSFPEFLDHRLVHSEFFSVPAHFRRNKQ